MTNGRMRFVSCSRRLRAAPRIIRGGAALGLAMFLTAHQVRAQDFQDAVAGEVGKAEMALLQVNHLLSEGDRYAQDGDLGRAFAHYRKAFQALPKDASGEVFRKTAGRRYGDATVRYAEQLMGRNQGREARVIIEELLHPRRLPDHAAAKALLERLEDPEWVNPAATPQHAQAVDQVGRLLNEAEDLLAKGEYDEATDKYSQVLNLDEHNTAAREGLVKASRLARSYRDAAYDHTRAALMEELLANWQFNDPDAAGPSLRPKAIPELGSPQDAPLSGDIAERLTSIIVPEANFSGMTIEAAVAYLRELSLEHDPSGLGISFVLSTSPNIARTRPINMAVRSVPLIVLVRYATEFVGAKFRIGQYAVQILPLEEAEGAMVQRSFLAHPDFFTAGAFGGSGGSGDSFFGGEGDRVRVVSEQDFLEQQGITFPEGASATYFPSANRLVVSNTLANLDLIEALVSASVAAAPKQVVIKVTVMDIREESLHEMGVDWLIDGFQLEQENEVTAGGGTLELPVETGPAPSAYLPEASDFAFVDPVTGQVFGGYRVTGGLRSGQSAVGLDALDRVIGPERDTALLTRLAPGVISLKGQLTDPQFQAVLRTLIQNKAEDVVAAPFVTVKPGHRALIESGIEFPYPVEFDPPELPQEVFADEENNPPVTPAHPTSFVMRPLGFNLEVEPIISADGKTVDVHLKPEFIEFLGFINYGSSITAAGTDLLGTPTTTTVTDNRLTQPVFRVIREEMGATIYDGATQVIGGLTGSRRDTVKDKVPILGDLPVIGFLFRSSVDRYQRRAVVIFLTVKVIDAHGARLNRPLSAAVDPDFTP